MASLILLGFSSVKFKTHSEDLSALYLQDEFFQGKLQNRKHVNGRLSKQTKEYPQGNGQ